MASAGVAPKSGQLSDLDLGAIAIGELHPLAPFSCSDVPDQVCRPGTYGLIGEATTTFDSASTKDQPPSFWSGQHVSTPRRSQASTLESSTHHWQ